MIRRATVEDLEAIQDLFSSYADELDISEETLSDAYLTRMINEHVVLVHGELEGVFVGKINAKEKWADGLFLAVVKEKQRQGIGTALLNHFSSLVEEAGVPTIDLYVHPELVPWLERCGYDEGRTFVGMRKKL